MLAKGDVAAAVGVRKREEGVGEGCISGFKIRKSAYDTTYESGGEGGREDAVKL